MVTSKGSVAERPEEKIAECRHYWIIDAAGGPTSKGVCSLCGVQRYFKNYLEDAPWDYGEPAARDLVISVVSSKSTAGVMEEEE